MSIVVEQISKLYGSQKVLDQVSFTVKKGEIVGLLGVNGAGKSTLMNILSTLTLPTSGQAFLCGLDIAKERKKIKQQLGYLLAENPLYEDMYVREFLMLNAQIHKVHLSKIDEVIESVGIAAEAHKKISQLSKGFKQRVGIANILLHDPDVFILDEPTTGLDPNQLFEIRNLILELGKDKTILLSSHIMQEVEALCERVILLHHGKVIADKPIDELRKESDQVLVVEFDYRVEETFIKRLGKVKKVDCLGGFIYEISFSTRRDMRPNLFDFANENQLKILQLKNKNLDIENLFSKLTSSTA